VNEDARDEQLAATLAVPPLDDVTRRRLVRGALDALDDSDGTEVAEPPRERRSWAPLAAAAVVILLVVVGIVALGSAGNDSTNNTAARNAEREPTAGTPAAGTPSAAADSSSGAAASLVPGTVDLGDLGDLSSSAARQQARTEIAGSPTGDAAGVDDVQQLLGEVTDASCAAPLRAAETTVVGVGSATVDGDTATVVLAERNGVRTAYLLVAHPCSLHPL
jgi:hypothetical protein